MIATHDPVDSLSLGQAWPSRKVTYLPAFLPPGAASSRIRMRLSACLCSSQARPQLCWGFLPTVTSVHGLCSPRFLLSNPGFCLYRVPVS